MDPHVHGSPGPPESKPKQHLDRSSRFLQGSQVRQIERQTDRPTDHATWSVTIGRIYVRSTAMRLIINTLMTNTDTQKQHV